MALSIDDVQFLISEPGALWAHDYRRTREEADARAAELINTEGKPFNVESFEEFEARRKAAYLGNFKLSEITEDFYSEMLNCLPPIYLSDAMGFFMSEMTSGSITSQFVRYNGKHYGASVDITDRGTWITPEKIAALEPAPVLKWFPE